VRFNFVRHLGGAPDMRVFNRVIDGIRPLGWHVVLHLDAIDIGSLSAMIRALPIPFVIDHMGRVDAANGTAQPAFRALLELAGLPNCWIKISGAERISLAPSITPYPSPQPSLQRSPIARCGAPTSPTPTSNSLSTKPTSSSCCPSSCPTQQTSSACLSATLQNSTVSEAIPAQPQLPEHTPCPIFGPPPAANCSPACHRSLHPPCYRAWLLPPILIGPSNSWCRSPPAATPVIIDNRPGAGGAVGAAFVTRAKPDGYTMMVASNGPMTVNPFVNANLGYEPLKDFAPIALSSYIPHVLAVSEKSGIKSIAELIAKAKAGPINIGTSGVGSASHMTLARFEHAIGAKLTHVPYRGGGQLLPDVISGVIDGAMTEISNVVQLHKANQLRIIGSASVTRPQLAPDVATFDESGIKGFLAQSYVGLVAPAKTPTDIIEAVANAIRDGFAAGKPAATTVLGQGSAIAKPEEMTPAGFAAFLKREYDEMAIAAKAAGIVPS
jgi:tripartite-type tricarboxylate transporter receptor subunit TctC